MDTEIVTMLRLYVSGRTQRTEQAIRNLQKMCEGRLQGRYSLEVMDVLEKPELAEEEHILATPTLIRYSPPPVRRIVGDLSNAKKVLEGLDLMSVPSD